MLTLNKDTARYFSQNGFIRKQQRIAVWGICSKGEPCARPEKGEECAFMGLGEAVLKEESTGGN